MADLPQVPNLDPKARPAPAPAAAQAPAPNQNQPRPTTPNPVTSDSVEEVLQQSSEQTLRLSHLEDTLSNLNQTLGDLRDEMHAGFTEMRAVHDSKPKGPSTGETWGAGLAERLDSVERVTGKNGLRVSLVLALAIVQALLLGYWLFKNNSSQEKPPPMEPILPEVSAPLSDTAAQPIAPPAADTKPKKKPRKH